MYIRLLAVGSLKKSWARDGCGEFVKRLQGGDSLEIVELPASKAKQPDRQLAEESERIAKSLSEDDFVIVLDERGKDVTTQEFADLLSCQRDEGRRVTFVIGGAYGLSDDVRKRADFLLRLSAMTLPHELCRITFLEALYRAIDLGRGGKYHH